ncbi:hypothetical protein O3M35_004256 [Rhynocoris fuscipes]|uniref:Uncharacterized protein n=1 Tax=Rhynocoris fuscipes TaxID=488301 RepID=A0AAW1CFH4_9HEMI
MDLTFLMIVLTSLANSDGFLLYTNHTYGNLMNFINNEAENNCFNKKQTCSDKSIQDKERKCGPCPYKLELIQLPHGYTPPFLFSINCVVEGKCYKPENGALKSPNQPYNCKPRNMSVAVEGPQLTEYGISRKAKKYNISQGCDCICENKKTPPTIT